jgi:phospholipase D1/2
VNGKKQHPVCPEIKALRGKLWSKLFALDVTDKKVKVQPAKLLGDLINEPASPETWKAIQKQAVKNSRAYQKVFPFIPGDDMSIWPTWKSSQEKNTNASSGRKDEPMPFDTEFWNKSKHGEMPVGVLGFITALPVNWTKNEINDSKFNLTILAQILPNTQGSDYKAIAALTNHRVTENS